ncbi:MAG: DUF1360 domain-containing protein [Nocardioidaceae bacterium]
MSILWYSFLGIVCVLASARLTRLLTADTVTEPLRFAALTIPGLRALVHTEQVSTGDEVVVHAWGCDWCVSVWTSALIVGLVGLLALCQPVWFVVLEVAACSHVVGFLAQAEPE